MIGLGGHRSSDADIQSLVDAASAVARARGLALATRLGLRSDGPDPAEALQRGRAPGVARE